MSAILAFPGDLAVLARRSIGVTMVYLKVAHGLEGSYFRVCEDRCAEDIYQHLVKKFRSPWCPFSSCGTLDCVITF